MTKRNTTHAETPAYQPVLGDFFSLPILFDERDQKAIFPSEQSARWFLRQHRSELVKAQAIAIHAGRMLVNPDRVRAVAIEVAMAAAQASAKRT
jgi:hypothetical protein